MSKRKHLTVTIKGIEWKVFVQTHASYIREHGKDSKAVVYPDDREAYFDRSEARLRIIRHEVKHMFNHSTDTEHTTEMTVNDQEELDCTVYGNHKNAMSEVEDRIVDYILTGE